MVEIIDGQKLAEKIKDQITEEIVKLQTPACAGRRPNLAIILIGNREDSLVYVNLKEKEAKKVGIDTHLYKYEENISEREVIEMINHLNKDKLIDGILVQLPLPNGFDTDAIIKAINPTKDVDRFHPSNLEVLFKTCDHAHVMPPVFLAVLEMLKSIDCELAGKQVCVICNSDIFGKSLAKVLECKKAIVKVTHANDKDLSEASRKADILITAVDKKSFISKDMIKKDAIIIDIGIVKKGKKVYGNIDLNSVKNKASFISPVPGGVGPLTIAMVFKNTLELYKNRQQ